MLAVLATVALHDSTWHTVYLVCKDRGVVPTFVLLPCFIGMPGVCKSNATSHHCGTVLKALYLVFRTHDIPLAVSLEGEEAQLLSRLATSGEVCSAVSFVGSAPWLLASSALIQAHQRRCEAFEQALEHLKDLHACSLPVRIAAIGGSLVRLRSRCTGCLQHATCSRLHHAQNATETLSCGSSRVEKGEFPPASPATGKKRRKLPLKARKLPFHMA